MQAAMPMPTGSLEAYIQTVNRFPILTRKRSGLALRFRDHNDLDAARQLVLSTCGWSLPLRAATWGTGCRTPT